MTDLRRLAWPAAAAAGIFLVLEIADAFVATPLRELSSAIVELGLGATGFPITRRGTLLSTPAVAFDVVPACSGSTTLRVLLFVGILWAGIRPGLTPGRRVLAALAAVPLALAANAARVAALVVAGHLAGEEPGGVFHATAGIVAFLLATLAAFLLTDRLAADVKPAPPGRLEGILTAALLAFLHVPFLAWCVNGWRAGLDRFGWLFVVAGVALGARRWRRLPPRPGWERAGTAAFAASLLVLLAALLVDVNLLRGLSLLGTALALALLARGPAGALALLPSAGLVYLGFPTVSYQLQALTLPVFGTASLGASLAAKAALAAAAVVADATLPVPTPGPVPARQGRPLLVILAAAFAAFQGYALNAAMGRVDARRLEMSWLQSDWEGRARPVGRSEAAYFEGRVWSRRYTREDRAVDVLITSTGGDRHRAHPPEYCLTGDGWAVASSDEAKPLPGTRMRLRRGERRMSFQYWFSDGETRLGSYQAMLVEDTLRRLRGRRTDWFLFRAMSEAGDDALDDFLSVFAWRLE
ncbi:MAG TPA: EpsI family protein [Planctomycetota bacterium]